MDLKLDSNHDLAIENNDLVWIDGVDAVAQDVLIRLQFFLGEWFLDTRLGVPWFQKILGEKPRAPLVNQILRKAILTTPGMISINDFTTSYDGVTRKLTVEFRGTADSGTFEFNQELII
jgi:hypothetical protein